MSTLMTRNVLALIDNYGVEDPDDAWSNNILASDTIRLRSGAFGRQGDPEVVVDEASLEGARLLAEEIATLMSRIDTGMGSEGSEELEAFSACSTPDRTYSAIDEGAISALFGRALFPGAIQSIAAVSTDTDWWRLVEEDGDGDHELRARWTQLIAWFGDRSRFEEAAFVAIDHNHEPKGTADVASGGCAFPRMWLGRTKAGALVGLLGVVVYT